MRFCNMYSEFAPRRIRLVIRIVDDLAFVFNNKDFLTNLLTYLHFVFLDYTERNLADNLLSINNYNNIVNNNPIGCQMLLLGLYFNKCQQSLCTTNFMYYTDSVVCFDVHTFMHMYAGAIFRMN